LVDTESCNSVECADDCKVTLWSPWSECDVSCGGEGIQHRHRTIIVPSRRGGRRCPPLMRETQPCGEELCMADCIMSDWSRWSACTTTCGGGLQSRTRVVQVAPQNGGKPCPQQARQNKKCNSKGCSKFSSCQHVLTNLLLGCPHLKCELIDGHVRIHHDEHITAKNVDLDRHECGRSLSGACECLCFNNVILPS